MKIENTTVYGFIPAFLGMRNPMNSWDKSDTIINSAENLYDIDLLPEQVILGPNDLKLAVSLIKGGSEHRKFMRMIQIWVDLTLPLFIWTEFDTYKVATVRNSCSTMHKLGFRDLTLDDFENQSVMSSVLDKLNDFGQLYRKNKNIKLLQQMKEILPCSYLQKSTVNINYETALNIYNQRKYHRLSQWSGIKGICNWIEILPYMLNFIYRTVDFK